METQVVANRHSHHAHWSGGRDTSSLIISSTPYVHAKWIRPFQIFEICITTSINWVLYLAQESLFSHDTSKFAPSECLVAMVINPPILKQAVHIAVLLALVFYVLLRIKSMFYSLQAVLFNHLGGLGSNDSRFAQYKWQRTTQNTKQNTPFQTTLSSFSDSVLTPTSFIQTVKQ